MKTSLKYGLKTIAVVSAFSLASGMAFATEPGNDPQNAVHPDQATDSANNPDDVQNRTQNQGQVDPNEPVVNPADSTNSASDPSDTPTPSGELPENDGLDEDHGVNSDNVPMDE